MLLWHRFKEILMGKLMLQSDTQTRLVVHGSAQLCIPHASYLWRPTCVYINVF